jgi:hypothetical protein
VQLIKVKESYAVFKKLILYYGITELVQHAAENNLRSFADLASYYRISPNVRNGQTLADNWCPAAHCRNWCKI